MQKISRIEIPLSRPKSIFFGMISVIFVVIGIWFIVRPPNIRNEFFGNKNVLFMVGLAAVLFFGAAGVMIFRKLVKGGIALVIDEKGITNNSLAFSSTFISWKDVTGISQGEVSRQKFINIHVSNPDEYIARETGWLKRKMMEMNYRQFKSVITINPNSMNCDFGELAMIVGRSFEDYKKGFYSSVE